MIWKGRRKSKHVIDRRGEHIGRSARSGLGKVLLLHLFLKSSGKTKLVIILVALFGFLYFRGPMLETLGVNSGTAKARTEHAENSEMHAYLSTMMGDNETVWADILSRNNIQYRPAEMVIYNVRTKLPRGYADARSGPFYLPTNETIYIDPHFFTELKEKFGATGDFAEAYVVSHEYAHHIQHILGRLDALHSQHGKVSTKHYNQLSVRVELHADFLAGVFAHHAQASFGQFLESGDIEEAMRCAEAIGDDRLQQQAQGRVIRDSFTHGTSKQRAYWFNKGFTSGDCIVGEQLYSLPYSQL